MTDELRAKIGTVAGKLVQEAMATGLTWDEIVAAFGLAAKATAMRKRETMDISRRLAITGFGS